MRLVTGKRVYRNLDFIHVTQKERLVARKDLEVLREAFVKSVEQD